MPAAYFGCRPPSFMFFDHTDNLGFGKTPISHLFVLQRLSKLYIDVRDLRGVQVTICRGSGQAPEPPLLRSLAEYPICLLSPKVQWPFPPAGAVSGWRW
ncbi:hypothetical protein SAMN05443635_1188 [Roseobacter denitrificans OCh 114]|nr:hypothetical protein SAMN05443635_1188 [Roseobacter denitrificans OCh 114]